MDTSNADQTGRVEDQDYYHINRLVRWSPHGPLNVGDEIDVGSVTNPYFRGFKAGSITHPVNYADGSTDEIPGVRFLEYVLDGEVKNVPDLAEFAHVLANHLARHVGELVFEDIRRTEFPHLPSRQRCVWLVSNQKGVRYWLKRLRLVE